MTLLAHRGGWTATLADLASVEVPEATESYVPVPYGRLVEEVKLHIPRFGLQVEDEQYALAREGKQMFGVLTCRNGVLDTEWGLAIGLRSSYDRSLAVDLAGGARVFVCDNLSFHGETRASRKHTANVFRDLPSMIYDLLTEVGAMKGKIAAEIDQMKETQLTPEQSDHILVESVRRNALPASRLPKVLESFENMDPHIYGERTAWGLFNGFTAIIGSQSPWQQMDNTLRLTAVFRDCLN